MQKFCSKECFGQNRQIYYKNKSDNQPFVKGHCIVCDQDFDYKFRKDRGERKFCGRSCASKFYIQDGTFDAWRLRKNESIGKYFECSHCAKSIYRIPRDFDHALKFCDRVCKGKYWSVNVIGENHPCFGTIRTDEMKRKQKETLQRNHPGVENAFELSVRKTKTKPQIAIYEFLKQNRAEFNWQIEKNVKSTKCYADILCEDLKLIVEFFGDYWHCNPRGKQGDPKFFHPKKQLFAEQIWAMDLHRKQMLENLGYTVEIIWEDEYRNGSWKDKVDAIISQYTFSNNSLLPSRGSL